MKEEIKIPALGESITEAVISVIIKKTGSMVKTDDEIIEIETEKVNQLLYAPCSGKLDLQVNIDDTVAIGQVIGSIEKMDVPDIPSNPQVEKKEEKTQEKKIETVETQPKEEKVKTEGEGIGARVKEDQFLSQLKEEEREEKSIPIQQVRFDSNSKNREVRHKMSRIRQTIARRLLEVKQNTALLTTFNEVDMSDVIHVRKKHKEDFEKEHNTRLGFMSFFVKACVAALKSFPKLNSYIDEDELVERQYYDIGIAISNDRGLVVPVIKDCDKLSFADIEKSIVDFSNKARKGGLTIEDLQGGSFSITNGGVFGSMLSTPILNPPQSGILGMHSITERAVVREGKVEIRPMMYLALTYDHRVVDGKEAISFLAYVAKIIEDPACLLIDL